MRLIVIVILVTLGGTVYGEVRKKDRISLLIQALGDYHYSRSAADSVAGALYTQKFGTGATASAAVGIRPLSFFYVGVRYEYWFAMRRSLIDGNQSNDLLRYHGPVGEVGFYTENPRTYYLLTVGVMYPLLSEIQSIGRTFTPVGYRFSYSGRLLLGVKFNYFCSLIVHAGYRYAPLGDFAAGGENYVTGGLDLSGPFVGMGLGIHF